jgi:hypothetical protein
LPRAGRHAGLVAISDGQRAKGPHLPWLGRVYNAVPVDKYPFEMQKEDFCLFLGRISAEKAPDLAIQAARRAGYPTAVGPRWDRPAQSGWTPTARRMSGRRAIMPVCDDARPWGFRYDR